MSIELRLTTPDDCTCGVLHVGEPPVCRHDVVCEFGTIEHTCPRPELGEVGSLIIAGPVWVDELLRRPAERDQRGYYARRVDGRLFLTLDVTEFGFGCWTWELFEAHFQGDPDVPWFVGRWPD